MFTGIIECTGKIEKIDVAGTNKIFWIRCPITHELKIDQSLSHDGICLTVEEIKEEIYRVTAIAETLAKTNVRLWKLGWNVNLERSMMFNGRIDGHIVQGHIDTTVKCCEKKAMGGSWEYTFDYDEKFAHLLIEKGSVCINGISLTVFNVSKNTFSVAIIPYTYNNTGIKQVNKEDTVNIEFDIIGKYLFRFNEVYK